MLSNSTYNLMESATVISKGLYRYDTFKKDAKDCQHCQQIWDQMRRADEEQLKRITSHLKQHMDKEGTAAGVTAA
ncbi:MAG TPA: hypothetical protein VNN07_07760 [Candidatus Tectomicrobia bacterium]|nr:hypothetical protein [Candidatus Tectomicrobia bacterium]